MSLTVSTPTQGALLLGGAVIACTISGGVVTPITSGGGGFTPPVTLANGSTIFNNADGDTIYAVSAAGNPFLTTEIAPVFGFSDGTNHAVIASQNTDGGGNNAIDIDTSSKAVIIGFNNGLGQLLSGGIVIDPTTNNGQMILQFNSNGLIIDADPSMATIRIFGLPTSEPSIANGMFSKNGALLLSGATAKILVEDTGWTANADAGDKTASIASSASLATLATAMNLAVAGSGTALVAIANKVKALETALVANLLPNT